MANDGGTTSLIEQAIVDLFEPLKIDGKSVFKTVEVWKWQIGADEGGLEAIRQYAPFLFVSYEPPSGGREADSLNQILRFAITIGVESKEAGVARTGDANHFGTSKLRDIVIEYLDKWHPGGSIACDPLYYQNEVELVSSKTRHVLDMYFQANMITN